MLAAYNWDIDAFAASQGDDRKAVVRRMVNAGLDYLLNPEVVAAASRPQKG